MTANCAPSQRLITCRLLMRVFSQGTIITRRSEATVGIKLRSLPQRLMCRPSWRAMFVIRPPRTLPALWRRQVRIAYGNLQLAALGRSLVSPAPGWSGVVRARPWLAGAAFVYLAINATALLRARSLLRSGAAGTWNRDETSRVSLVAHGSDR